MTDLPPPPPPWSPPPGPPPGTGAPDAGAAISYGWKKFQENVGPMLTVVLIPVAAQIVLSIIGQTAIKSLAALLLFQILGIVVSAIAGLGLYRMALMITAGETPSVSKAFQYDRMGPWIIFSVVFGLLTGLGIVLCVIPGLLFLAYFGLAPFFFLDRGMSLGESFSASREAVSSKGLAFPVLLSIVVGVLGLIACIIGVFVTEAIAYIAVAYLYRYATGQPVAA
ncbi:MAG TPA: hypothetical protein VGP92_07345 [Acidimicrobiia bacterium]|nr:hypothetical protein [Acidimicrobiia bacterium]